MKEWTINPMCFGKLSVPVGEPIYIISVDWTTSILKMHTNLVRPSSLDTNLSETELVVEYDGIHKGYGSSARLGGSTGVNHSVFGGKTPSVSLVRVWHNPHPLSMDWVSANWFVDNDSSSRIPHCDGQVGLFDSS
eukprot:CAMPEP_0116567494 /NCGR_PEP_ID=MMETSP0397-20121206/15037_1 /TAXON_ID=216820 /ORGANISM="Cyclophora tenuis, Strain ECT3854" /LENGTH=134 /DNA_ID=CAMNT_0004094489 /DNA_START=199 /DNA_END=603 /DNA_ORIENTATION=+